MADSIFFSGRIEEAIAATVANRKPLACFITDESDDSNVWETEYLAEESVSNSLRDSAIAVRLLKDSTEANYLNAFCAITTYPTFLVIKNGGAGTDGLTVITNPISKEDFVSKISSTFASRSPTTLLDGVNSSPSFPASSPPTVDTTAEASSASAAPPAQDPESTDLPANTQFPPESATARRLASIQQQHRERIARLKSERAAAEIEEQKKRELARRQDTKAMAEAAETKNSRSNRQYAEEQKKRKMEAEKERRRVLEQIKADREEMKIREANRKAIAAEAEMEAAPPACAVEKGKGKAPAEGSCSLAFRLLDGSRITHKFDAQSTIEGDVRPWLDNNRTDSSQPYKLVVQAAGTSSKNIEGNLTLSELGLFPSAILILKPIASSKVASAFAPVTRRVATGNNQHNFLIAFLLSIWLMIKTFLGMHDPTASVVIGDKKDKENAEPAVTAESGASTTPVVSRDAARKRIRTLHDGDGDKRSAYYNGNQLDFEPKKQGDEGEQ